MNNKKITYRRTMKKDIQPCLTIYNHYILHSTATFSTNEHTPEEMESILFSGDERFASFVIEAKDTIVGYVLLNPYKKREAYRYTAEVTVYLDPEWTGMGIGTDAIKWIENYAKQNQFHALLAVVCAENQQSVKLFKQCGYESCAFFREVGLKFDRILDVVVLEKLL